MTFSWCFSDIFAYEKIRSKNSFTSMRAARSATITSAYTQGELFLFRWCSKTKLTGKRIPSFHSSIAGKIATEIDDINRIISLIKYIYITVQRIFKEKNVKKKSNRLQKCNRLLNRFARKLTLFRMLIELAFRFDGIPISTMSLATRRLILLSCSSTTGFFVTTSKISASTSKSPIGNEGTKCVARTKGRWFKFGIDIGSQILGTAAFQVLNTKSLKLKI